MRLTRIWRNTIATTWVFVRPKVLNHCVRKSHLSQRQQKFVKWNYREIKIWLLYWILGRSNFVRRSIETKSRSLDETKCQTAQLTAVCHTFDGINGTRRRSGALTRRMAASHWQLTHIRHFFCNLLVAIDTSKNGNSNFKIRKNSHHPFENYWNLSIFPWINCFAIEYA